MQVNVPAWRWTSTVHARLVDERPGVVSSRNPVHLCRRAALMGAAGLVRDDRAVAVGAEGLRA